VGLRAQTLALVRCSSCFLTITDLVRRSLFARFHSRKMEAYLVGIARLALTLAALALGGRLGALIDAPLVGEILVGVLLGPDGAGFVPENSAVVLVGDFALCLLVMEGGLSIDVGALKSVGPIAFAIAVSGTMLPIALGVAYMSACGYGVMAGVAAGTSLSSTSIGMATKVLQTLGELTSPLGNLVCVAAMVDDVLSLVILAVVSNVEGDDQGGGRDVAWMTSRPILASVGVCVIGTGLAVATPRVVAMNRAAVAAPGGKAAPCGSGGKAPCGSGGSGFGAGAKKIAKNIAGTLFPTADDAVVWAMLGLSLGVVVAAGAAGSTHLLGAFVGGAAFSGLPNARRAFSRYAELNAWLTSVFFLSVGTRIPLRGMFDASGVALGAGYSVVAVAGKLVTGAWCHPDWRKARAVGWAMVGRGELGFVMAQSAHAGGLMGDAPYVASVWALLVATAASPVFMRRAIDVWKRGLETGVGNGLETSGNVEDVEAVS